jgi:sulfur-oxidizing protein SoxZ
MKRRALLGRFFSALLAGVGLGRAGTAAAQALGINWNRKAFAARTPEDALKALGQGGTPVASPELQLDVSLGPAQGDAQMFAYLTCTRPDVRRVVLLAEKDPTPLSCVVDFNDGAALPLRLPIKAEQGGGMVAFAVLADGRVLTARDEMAGAMPRVPASINPASPPEPTRIRAQLSTGFAVVRAWLSHGMEPGRPAADPATKPVEAWHITEVLVQHDGRAVLRLQCGPWVARDPVLQFNLGGAKLGDRIKVSWLDNRGRRRADEGAVGY